MTTALRNRLLLRKTAHGAGSLGCCGLGSLDGDTASQIAANATKAVTIGLEVATDPYLPEMLCRFQQLAAIEKKKPIPTCVKMPLVYQGGIGLRNAILPARGYVYAQQHKWAYLVAGAALVGLPLWLGYELGKRI